MCWISLAVSTFDFLMDARDESDVRFPRTVILTPLEGRDMVVM